jgi:hypothetical protein
MTGIRTRTDTPTFPPTAGVHVAGTCEPKPKPTLHEALNNSDPRPTAAGEVSRHLAGAAAVDVTLYAKQELVDAARRSLRLTERLMYMAGIQFTFKEVTNG